MQNAKRVLIVEDDFLVGEKLSGTLKELGHTVVGETASGEQAVRMTADLKPDVVMMDLDLVELDGLTAARRITARCPTPIVALTAHESPALLAEAGESGVGYYLVKPAHRGEIARAISIAVARFDDLMDVRCLNAKLQDALTEAQRRESETEWLLAASQAVLECHRFEDAARRIFDVAREATGAVSGYVALMSDDGQENELLFLEAGGLPCEVDPDLPMPIRGLRAEAYAQAAVVYDNDFDQSEWMAFIPPRHVEMRNVMFAPLIIGGRAVGVIGLANKPTDFTAGDVRMAKAFGDMAAIALRRVQAEEAIERYAADLERSNEDLEQFAYVISHDLREPVRMIRSFLQLLEDRFGDRLPPKAQEYVAYAVDGAGRMHEMIGALLDLSRVGTRGKDPAPTEVEAVLERTLKSLGRVIEEAGAEVTHAPLPTVLADRAQLAQVFQNLIANGIKFCREGVPPRVHVSAEREGDEWLFSVADNGIGIDLEQAGRLFQIFQRLHTAEEYPGTGIGLALCRRIVERHGGRIWVESEPGRGSTFFFTLAGVQGDKDE
jgi:signal transduction histidine kinase/AmiR/NasT family two-component response regulator